MKNYAIDDSLFLGDPVRVQRKNNITLFCAILYVNALVVADITSVKLFSTTLFGLAIDFLGEPLLFPAGTLAFAITFLATDVICEVHQDRKTAIMVVLISVFLRVLTIAYLIYAVGDARGAASPVDVPQFWTEIEQKHYEFVFRGSLAIYIGGFVSILLAFLDDIYIFNYFREQHRGRNPYWLRNGLSTMISQLINSTVFISLVAFASVFTIPQIISAILGQCVIKFMLAWLDTPLAYILRNYGQGRRKWFAIWSSSFWKG